MSKKVLVIFAHPALEKSRVHTELIKGLDSLGDITFHDLYEAYPNFEVDVNREKELLLEHDILVFQHPLYWYSVPALIKEWIDLVLEHGWAYGHNGSALRNKYWLNVITTGGRQEAYSKETFFKHTLREFLAPLEYTAKLCKMRFLSPYVIYGTHVITPQIVARQKQVLHNFLKHLSKDDWDYRTYMQAESLIELAQELKES